MAKVFQDGTSQRQRLLDTLIPEYFKVDDRSLENLLAYMYAIAGQLKFYNADNQVETNPDGTHKPLWQNFFHLNEPDLIYGSNQEAFDHLLKNYDKRQNLPAQLALILTFLKLYQQSVQTGLNKLTERHLNYYYHDVLRFERRKATAEQVHLLFTLVKDLNQHRLEAGTKLKAGKINGQEVLFQTDREIVLNKARIESIKSIYLDSPNGARLYAAASANTSNGRGLPFDNPEAIWPLFGENQIDKPAEGRNMEEADFGFLIASPQFLLSSGTRTITLDIGFADGSAPISQPQSAFSFAYSSPKGWLPLLPAAQINAGRLTLTFVLPVESAPWTNYITKVHGYSLKTEWPVLRAVFNSRTGLYPVYRDILIASIDIRVKAEHINNFYLQNDFGILAPDKPFQPFGPNPKIGNFLYFGHEEIFRKRLNWIGIRFRWQDVPAANLGKYYGAYFLPILERLLRQYFTTGTPNPAEIRNNAQLILNKFIDDSTINSMAAAVNSSTLTGYTKQSIIDAINPIEITNAKFIAEIDIRNQQNWKMLSPNNNHLFNTDATQSETYEVGSAGTNSYITSGTYNRQLNLSSLESNPNEASGGYLRLKLNGPSDANGPFTAFGHAAYSQLYTQQILRFSTFNANPNPSGPEPSLPDKPYTPVLENIQLSYESYESFKLNDPQAIEQFFHLEPFGNRKIDPGEMPYLLPQFKAEGSLYIGLKDLKPPQTISILFQLAEGSGNPQHPLEKEDIGWSYLAGDEWISFKSLDIVIDTTLGLQSSGIIAFSVGKDATENHTRMPAGIYWIRGQVMEQADGASKAIALHTQAISATRILTEDNLLSEERLTLEAGKISKLLNRDGAVKIVEQPYASFGGKSAEFKEAYYARVSERLRHKQRAVTGWDYERLVLEEFPDIYKVKCLNHQNLHAETTPGSLSLVLVQNQLNKNAVNPLQPKVSTATLAKVESYIKNYTSAHVDVYPQNPVYEQILLDIKVGFFPEKDAGYFGQKLNKEIIRFLSPWAFEEGQEIVIGGRIHRSEILNFVENRDYVDYVATFDLYHIFDGVPPDGIGDMKIGIDFIIAGLPKIGIGDMEMGENFIIGFPEEEAIATDPRAILVSFPEHRIEVLKPGEYVCSGKSAEGIGFMSVGVDFEVFPYEFAVGTMQIAESSNSGQNYIDSGLNPSDFIISNPDLIPAPDAEGRYPLPNWALGHFNPPHHLKTRKFDP